MEFDNSFGVTLPPAEAWRVLMDVERIVPCLPGAALTQRVDDRTFKGTVAVRLGPVALSFAGTARFEDVDDIAHTAHVKATGADSKGRGGANATASFRVEPDGTGSNVLVHTDLTLSGSVAQYGRGVGMIQVVSAELIRQFADNLHALIAAQAPAEAAPATAAPGAPLSATPSAARPISGFALLWRALWARVAALFSGTDSRAR